MMTKTKAIKRPVGRPKGEPTFKVQVSIKRKHIEALGGIERAKLDILEVLHDLKRMPEPHWEPRRMPDCIKVDLYIPIRYRVEGIHSIIRQILPSIFAKKGLIFEK